jgi:hypothetical protein
MQQALQAIKNKAKNRRHAGFFVKSVLLNQELPALSSKHFSIERYLKMLHSKRKQLSFLMFHPAVSRTSTSPRRV